MINFIKTLEEIGFIDDLKHLASGLLFAFVVYFLVYLLLGCE